MGTAFRNAFVTVCIGALILLESCATSDKSSAKSDEERSRAWVTKIALTTLHYRRPAVASADPNAGPGGADYRSRPLPGERLDCQPSEKLFEELKLSKIRECLNSKDFRGRDFILTYSVQKSIQPKLILQKEEIKKEGKPRRPSCVDQLLNELPVPREIYFQGIRGDKTDHLECYASGIVPEGRPALGFEVFAEKSEVAVILPRVFPLRSDEETRLLLLSWVLKPFWDIRKGEIPARLVPDRLCRLCIGEKNLVRIHVPPVPLWPSESESEIMQSVTGDGTEVPVADP